MNAASAACAPSRVMQQWDRIDWSRCKHHARRLQARIVKATQESRHGKAKALQWLLTHSFSGRALAVKRVTENKGKDTSGVDGLVWRSPEAKARAIGSLRRRGYQPQSPTASLWLIGSASWLGFVRLEPDERNHHVRFLGEGAAATPHPHPTDHRGGVVCKATPHHLAPRHANDVNRRQRSPASVRRLTSA